MNPLILTGKAGSGKDTAALYLCTHYNYMPFALAKPIKQLANKLFPYHPNKRELYQRMGAYIREIDPLVWIQFVDREIQNLSLANLSPIITDVRFRNEYDYFTLKGYTPVRIVADKDIRIARLIKRDGQAAEERLNHFSETELDDVYITTIENNGTLEEFYRKLDEFIGGEGRGI